MGPGGTNPKRRDLSLQLPRLQWPPACAAPHTRSPARPEPEPGNPRDGGEASGETSGWAPTGAPWARGARVAERARRPGAGGARRRARSGDRRRRRALTPRRQTLSSRIAIMCSGPCRPGTQQHRPGAGAAVPAQPASRGSAPRASPRAEPPPLLFLGRPPPPRPVTWPSAGSSRAPSDSHGGRGRPRAPPPPLLPQASAPRRPAPVGGSISSRGSGQTRALRTPPLVWRPGPWDARQAVVAGTSRQFPGAQAWVCLFVARHPKPWVHSVLWT